MQIGLVAIAAALAVFTGVGAGIGMGMATSKAVESVARQPEASGKINTMLLLGLALTESTAIYGFVTALLIIFVMGA
ncbi:MAG: ATP synthase F0 subunit C [Clostridiales bacterium]|nr:ATP synthase F0 subunit C [Clostridiales bacterium]